MLFQDFLSGNVFDAHEFFGAHLENDGVIFRVYAPNAHRVSLIGDFSSWQEIPMEKVDYGLYEAFVQDAKVNMLYKFRIYYNENDYMDHCDPYGNYMELRPNSASIIYDVNAYKFNDMDYMHGLDYTNQKPLNIYEIHLGGWKENFDNENGWYNYKQIGEMLPSYLKENGYNAVEIMPLCEYPADESWGYQSTGFFAPTSRYGTPSDLQEMIDILHQNDIKVILDFVPVHFAVDGYALARFDGTPLYEYPDGDMSYSEWGSCNFNHGKGEVISFLKSSINYWISKYHFDGIRMDAISRIIYYHGDPKRGVNNSGIEFIKSMNYGIRNIHKHIILIAEDSTDYPNITKNVEDGGLGFDYKWDMGWMNDTLDFLKKTPQQRKQIYHKITFSMMYYYNENYLLSFSHDENVHSKATILQKMYGNYEDKFPQARALYMYMMTHPGKKLNFMGAEIGQFREFDEERGLDLDILKNYPIHVQFNKYMTDLNNTYLNNPALYEKDYDHRGFRWHIVEDMQGVTYAYSRISENQIITSVFNFSDEFHPDYEYKIPCKVMLKEILNTDWDIYGGKTSYVKDSIIKSVSKKKELKALEYYDDFSTDEEIQNPSEENIINKQEETIFEHYIKMDLPPFSARMFEVQNTNLVMKHLFK